MKTCRLGTECKEGNVVEGKEASLLGRQIGSYEANEANVSESQMPLDQAGKSPQWPTEQE